MQPGRPGALLGSTMTMQGSTPRWPGILTCQENPQIQVFYESLLISKCWHLSKMLILEI